jgi:hypothetical protein
LILGGLRKVLTGLIKRLKLRADLLLNIAIKAARLLGAGMRDGRESRAFVRG